MDVLHLLAADPEAAKAFLNITIHWAAIGPTVLAAIVGLGGAAKWLFGFIERRNKEEDQRVTDAVDANDKSVRGHFKPVCENLTRERDEAIASRDASKEKLDNIREELWLESMPVIKQANQTLVEFGEILATQLDQMTKAIDADRESYDQLKPLLRQIQRLLQAIKKAGD